MSKNNSNYKKQINKLYSVTVAESLSLGAASWVALLSLRGFSLAQIGIIEAIFHAVSLMAEIPSGAVADVLGRKKTMAASRCMTVLSAILMILSHSFGGVVIAMAFSALSYNLASGTREALAFDTLKAFNSEEKYNKYASNEMMIYRIGTGISTLFAGLALYLGYRKAYTVDIILGIVGIIIVLMLREYSTNELSANESILCQIKTCIIESFRFLKSNSKALKLIMFNSIIGAISTLLLFFLQAKLPLLGLPHVLLGPSLLCMTFAAALGAKVISYCDKWNFKTVAFLACIGIFTALATLLTYNPYLIILGGAVSAFSDDFMEVRTDVILNNMIPSEQRATLISVSSFSFSLIMIILSPIMGSLLELL